MDLNFVSFWLNARTKKEKEQLPVNCRCTIRLRISEYGIASIGLWSKSEGGKFAEITISAPDEMKKMAGALLAIANAQIILNDSAPQN